MANTEKVKETLTPLTNRGLIKYILLSLITFGIYSIWFWYRLVKDLNVACSYDGKKTTGLIVTFLLTLITFGIYGIIWQLMIVSRIDNGANHFKVESKISLLSYILWNTVGLLLFGLGPIIALYKQIKSMNIVCEAYNNSI